MSGEEIAVRELEACPNCISVFARPTMPGYNKVPKRFLNAITWAYLCDGCALIVLGLWSHGADKIPAFREPLSCQKCFKSLDDEFKRDRETAGRKVNHPKAASYVAWCDECVVIVRESCAKQLLEKTKILT